MLFRIEGPFFGFLLFGVRGKFAFLVAFCSCFLSFLTGIKAIPSFLPFGLFPFCVSLFLFGFGLENVQFAMFLFVLSLVVFVLGLGGIVVFPLTFLFISSDDDLTLNGIVSWVRSMLGAVVLRPFSC